MEEINEKPLAKEVLRELLSQAGLSVRALALAAGYKTGSGLQNYIDGEHQTFPVSFVERIAPILIGKGDPPITLAKLLCLIGVAVPAGSDPDPTYYDLLGVPQRLTPLSIDEQGPRAAIVGSYGLGPTSRAAASDPKLQTSPARMELMPDRTLARIVVNEIVPYDTAVEIMQLLRSTLS